MNGLLFLVSIFSTFGIEEQTNITPIATQVLTPGIEIEFAAAPHLSVGDPVFFKGQPVGSISSIEINSEVKNTHSIVKVKITDLSVPLNENFIALVAKIKVRSNQEASRKAEQTLVRSAVELMQLTSSEGSPVVQSQTKVHGFASFEEFWKSTSRISL